ncbi:MAG: hypothetical protein ACRDDX_09820, partial [Cellulosilyticaceae bacterium]
NPTKNTNTHAADCENVSTEGTQYFHDKALKSATNNQWVSNISDEGTKYFHDKAEKSATNNQWVSTGAAKG